MLPQRTRLVRVLNSASTCFFCFFVFYCFFFCCSHDIPHAPPPNAPPPPNDIRHTTTITVGKSHMMKAISMFHDKFADTQLQLNVTRHPYSFLGDSKPQQQQQQRGGGSGGGQAKALATWHQGLKSYTDNTEEGALLAEAGLSRLGAAAGIKFRYDVKTDWQPVDSQRLLLWCGRFGKQEEFMNALNADHFQEARSASERPTLLGAVAAAGLDAAAAANFLDTDELVDTVWSSYGSTIHDKNIHAIPLFVFSVPSVGIAGGPFREPGDQGEPFIVKGSANAETYLEIFEGAREAILIASSSS